MFFRLATEYFPNNTHDLFLLHPEQLANFLEAAWINADRNGASALGSGNRPRPFELLNYDYPQLRGLPTVSGMGNVAGNYQGADLTTLSVRVDWNHLIYAYLVENSRVTQIFRRVLHLYTHGEELNTASPQTQAWLRNTEMLFYRHLPGFYTYNLRSEVRPDPEAIRRNAYYRMFGMDLAHGDLNNKPYPYEKARHANRAFVATLEQLLGEIHVAIINSSNSSGANSTDFASIATLCTNLSHMMQVRRQGGTLTREEFNAVAVTSWFHLTLMQSDLPLITDLAAMANSPEGRLRKIGKKVKLNAHPLSDSFFELAPLLSEWLLQLEEGSFNTVAQVQSSLLSPAYRERLSSIITHWSMATGRNIKRGQAKPLAGIQAA